MTQPQGGAEVPDESTEGAEVAPPVVDSVPEARSEARARRGRRRRRKPVNPADLAGIADATGVLPALDEPPTEPEQPAEPADARANAIPMQASGSPEAESVGVDPDSADGSDGDEADDDLASSVRPYSWTRGRTRSTFELQLETLISTTDHGRDMAALTSIEHRAVAELCSSARSVAEVAALLELPLGVARVVVGDMAGLELVAVHDGPSGDVPDPALMERVLSGLRRL